MTATSNLLDTRFGGDLLNRVMPIRAVDIILSLLQATFAAEDLIDGKNPLRFNRSDPKNSRLWICDPDGRIDAERDGRRMLVSVSRGEVQPAEAHMHNYAGGNMHGEDDFTDLVTVPVNIQCEAGNRTAVEFLANACYSIIKIFRQQLLKDYGITNIRVLGVTPPTRTEGVPGDPWLCSVLLRCEYQEWATVTQAANHLNYVNLNAEIRQTLATAGGPPPPDWPAVRPVLLRESSELLDRVMPIRAVDIVLALFQAAFGQDNLMGDGNVFRFNRNDPKNSRLWICDPDSRIDTQRDGRRSMITVTRGELVPSENHLHNFAGGDMHGTTEFTDMISVPVAIQCEAGSRSMVEVLAHACYTILKVFRWQLFHDYGISGITVLGIGIPQRSEGIPGDPWLCTVTVRFEYQERAKMLVDANHLNYLNINAVMQEHIEPTQPMQVVAQALHGVQALAGQVTDQGIEFTVKLDEIFFQGVAESPTVTLQLSTAELGTEIYYVEGNRDPTIHDVRYTGPIVITTPGRHYFSARAFKVGLLPSPVLHVSYDLQP